MKIRIQQNSALHEKGGRFKNEDFIYPLLDNAQIDSTVAESIPNLPGLYMICDGVGGEQKGEIASQLAVAQFAKYIDTFPPSGQVTYGYLSAALIRVEEAFSNYLKAHPDSRGMGTTLALLYLDDHGAMIAWIGDTRVYHFRKGEILYKTRDHSLVNDLIEQGEITEAAARYHPRRNVVLRVIKGTEEATDLDVHFIPADDIESGDFFMLCSDGVLEEVNDNELQTLFSGEFNAEDISQEIYSLCKGNSNDNFSAYVVQLGEKSQEAVPGFEQASIASATMIEEDDDYLLVDDVEEPPMEVDAEENTVFAQIEDSQMEEHSVLDQLGKLHVHESEKEEDVDATPTTQTVFDRLNKHAREEKMNQQEEYTEEEPAASVPPPPAREEKDRNAILVPAVLVSIVLLAFVAIIWLFQSDRDFQLFSSSNSWKTTYQQYLTDAQGDLDAGNYQQAIQAADSAMKLAQIEKSDGEIAEAQRLRSLAEEKIEGLKEQKMLSLMAMAEQEMRNQGQYPSHWRAKEYLRNILLNYGELVDSLGTTEINKKIILCEEVMNNTPAPQAFEQLLAKAQELCNTGATAEAELFFTEASGFASQLQKDDVLFAAQTKCFEPVVATTETQPEDAATSEGAETASRGLQPANARTAEPIASNSTAVPANTAPATDAASSQRTSAPNSTPALAANSGKQTGPGGSFLAETAVPVSATTPTRGGVSARMAGGGTAVFSSMEAQQKSLESGKNLFRKAAKSGSAFESQRAIEYIEQAGPSIDGEGYYMLAVLYHNGKAMEKDLEKALEYASLSKKNEYTGGYYLYGVYLLETNNPIDRNNAIAAIKIAAKRSYQPAIQKLQDMGI